jgi:hypothetical protein
MVVLKLRLQLKRQALFLLFCVAGKMYTLEVIQFRLKKARLFFNFLKCLYDEFTRKQSKSKCERDGASVRALCAA